MEKALVRLNPTHFEQYHTGISCTEPNEWCWYGWWICCEILKNKKYGQKDFISHLLIQKFYLLSLLQNMRGHKVIQCRHFHHLCFSFLNGIKKTTQLYLHNEQQQATLTLWGPQNRELNRRGNTCIEGFRQNMNREPVILIPEGHVFHHPKAAAVLLQDHVETHRAPWAVT